MERRRGGADRGGAQHAHERRHGKQPVDPTDQYQIVRRNGVETGVGEHAAASRDGARRDRDHRRAGERRRRRDAQSRARRDRGFGSEHPPGEAREKRDGDRDDAAAQIGGAIDRRRVQPEADRRPRQRSEREEIAPRKRDGAVAPPRGRRRPRLPERHDVVQSHHDEVQRREAGGGPDPARVERAHRRPHFAQVNRAQRPPRQPHHDRDGDRRPHARRVAQDPQRGSLASAEAPVQRRGVGTEQDEDVVRRLPGRCVVRHVVECRESGGRADEADDAPGSDAELRRQRGARVSGRHGSIIT